MVLLMMLLAMLNVGDYNRPLTAEEQQTKECHEFCNGVESRISQHVSACKDITSTSATGGNICSSNHGSSDIDDRN